MCVFPYFTLYIFRLGGDKGSKGVSWPSLHPRKLFDEMSLAFPSFPLTQFKEFMKQAGISEGYQVQFLGNPFRVRQKGVYKNLKLKIDTLTFRVFLLFYVASGFAQFNGKIIV